MMRANGADPDPKAFHGIVQQPDDSRRALSHNRWAVNHPHSFRQECRALFLNAIDNAIDSQPDA